MHTFISLTTGYNVKKETISSFLFLYAYNKVFNYNQMTMSLSPLKEGKTVLSNLVLSVLTGVIVYYT